MFDALQDVTSLDLLAASRTPQLRSLLLEGQSERIMRSIALSLFQRSRHNMQLLSCVSGVISHSAAVSALPDVMLAGIADLGPLGGRIIVVVEGDLIGAVVDSMCGANGGEPFMREQLSVMETRVGKQMIELTLSTLSETLGSLTSLQMTVDQYETTASLIAIADGQDWMISTTGIFASDLGIGSIKIIVPYASFEPLEARLNSQGGLIAPRASDATWVEVLDKLADITPVEFRLELVRTRISLHALQALTPGQVLPCRLLADGIGVVGDVDLFQADFGQADGYVCCRPKLARGRDGEAVMANPKDGSAKLYEGEFFALTRGLGAQGKPRALPGRGDVGQVQVLLTVELGRTHISVKDLRQLRHGQLIVLDQGVEEDLDIFANGRHVAAGEVVALGRDQYGIRVTRLVRDEPARDAAA